VVKFVINTESIKLRDNDKMKDTDKSPEVSILESVGAMMQQNNITSGVDGNASYITNNQVVLV